jgi:IS5 family transposase
MIQEQLAESQQDDGTDQEERKQLVAIEAELGVKPATLEPGSNWGPLILDATCVPDDIPYSVDLRLLDEARESTDKIIDPLFA